MSTKANRQTAMIEKLMSGGMDVASAAKAAAILQPAPSGPSKAATDYVEQQNKASEGIRKFNERAAAGDAAA